MLAGLIWYGKLPKISIYHWYQEGYSPFNKRVFTDIYFQGEKYYPDSIKSKIAVNEIIKLMKNDKEFNLNMMKDVNILDNEFKPFGTQTLYSFILGKLNK